MNFELFERSKLYQLPKVVNHLTSIHLIIQNSNLIVMFHLYPISNSNHLFLIEKQIFYSHFLLNHQYHSNQFSNSKYLFPIELRKMSQDLM
jgi:hypothetical protein